MFACWCSHTIQWHVNTLRNQMGAQCVRTLRFFFHTYLEYSKIWRLQSLNKTFQQFLSTFREIIHMLFSLPKWVSSNFFWLWMHMHTNAHIKRIFFARKTYVNWAVIKQMLWYMPSFVPYNFRGNFNLKWKRSILFYKWHFKWHIHSKLPPQKFIILFIVLIHECARRENEIFRVKHSDGKEFKLIRRKFTSLN